MPHQAQVGGTHLGPRRGRLDAQDVPGRREIHARHGRAPASTPAPPPGGGRRRSTLARSPCGDLQMVGPRAGSRRMSILEAFTGAIGAGHVDAGDRGRRRLRARRGAHRRAPCRPAFVARPGTTAEVAALLAIAAERRRPGDGPRAAAPGFPVRARPPPTRSSISFERDGPDPRDRHREPRRRRPAGRDARPARRGARPPRARPTRSSPASTAPASAATSPPTRAACGP